MSELKDSGGSEPPKPSTSFGQLQGLLERVSGVSKETSLLGTHPKSRRAELIAYRRLTNGQSCPFIFKVQQGAIVSGDRWDDQISIVMSTHDPNALRNLGGGSYSHELAHIKFSEVTPFVQLESELSGNLKKFVPLLGLQESAWRQGHKKRFWVTNATTEAAKFVDILTVAATPPPETRG